MLNEKTTSVVEPSCDTSLTSIIDNARYDVELGSESPIPLDVVDEYHARYPNGFEDFATASLSLLFCSQSASSNPVRRSLSLGTSRLGIRRDDQGREYVFLECADILNGRRSDVEFSTVPGFRNYVRVHFTADARRVIDSIWIAGDDLSWQRLASCEIQLNKEGDKT